MKATEKQLKYIEFIERESSVPYEGNTKQEASEYISENIDKVPFDRNISTWLIINGY